MSTTKPPSDEFIKIKHRGKIFTPDYLVNVILDRGHYRGSDILKKHVIDNSCGDGQFMIMIVDRYCREFLKTSTDLSKLKSDLETYIHAIEIEEAELDACKDRCDKVAFLYNIENVNWDFINGDALNVHIFDGKMDFVVGNPPYVRIHNLDKRDFIRNYSFCKKGMTDLFIVFYELSLRMLNSHGIISYITPSSFFTSLASSKMREYFVDNKILESICDLKHFQAFNATTYTAIVCLNKKCPNDFVEYAEFDVSSLKPKHISNVSKSDFCINNNFYFSDKESLTFLRSIMTNTKKADVIVKNGYATLADKIFIGDFEYDSKYIIPVIKASCAKWTKIIFPYDENGHLIDEPIIADEKILYNYLLSNKSTLLNRSNEKNPEKYWYAFGRSQGVNNTFKDKLSLNTLVRTPNDLKIIDVPSGHGVYSGLYIISDTIPYNQIKEALLKQKFCDYVSMLGKYKSGGYYTFSSKDVTNYLNYELTKKGDRYA